MYESEFFMLLENQLPWEREVDIVFPFRQQQQPQRNFKPRKPPYKEVEVAPWYGKAQNMKRAVNDYLAKQSQRHFEFVHKDFDFNGKVTIITKNKKSRVKETKKFYAR